MESLENNEQKKICYQTFQVTRMFHDLMCKWEEKKTWVQGRMSNFKAFIKIFFKKMMNEILLLIVCEIDDEWKKWLP